jgi:hypothetical protein
MSVEAVGAEPSPKAGTETALGRFRLAPAPRLGRPDPLQMTITWQTEEKTPAGTYRVVHQGRLEKDGKVERFTATSRRFQVSIPPGDQPGLEVRIGFTGG